LFAVKHFFNHFSCFSGGVEGFSQVYCHLLVKAFVYTDVTDVSYLIGRNLLLLPSR
ncbi:hypothetical protein OESDEN_24300, partial [Oesophagostomum dentatum]